MCFSGQEGHQSGAWRICGGAAEANRTTTCPAVRERVHVLTGVNGTVRNYGRCLGDVPE